MNHGCIKMPLGPVMLGLPGLALGGADRELLRHPRVGGVILFARNYETPRQLAELCAEIHALRSPRLLIGVDHEGGRVQRFREGFTVLPPMRRLGEVHDREPRRARAMATAAGWLMAAELRAADVDFSFAPVLDLDRGVSRVIGDRAFHSDPDVVSTLAAALMHGLQSAGMQAVGKHFPGHGHVEADSHHALPVDAREYADIEAEDLVPFGRLVRAGLAGVMPAHVVYARVDERTAGYSPFWLREVLRSRLGFQGAIFSDDLDMAGAALAGGAPLDCARAALAAGCDMVLACNDRRAALEIVHGLEDPDDPAAHLRLVRLHGRGQFEREALRASGQWQRAVRLLTDPLAPLDEAAATAT